MPTEYSLTAVIVLGLYLVIMILKWFMDKSAKKQKSIDDEDKKIDSINNGDDVTRIGDGLRNK